MPMRAITRAVRGGATSIVAGALVVGLAAAATADPTDPSTPTAEPTSDPTVTTEPPAPDASVPVVDDRIAVRLKVGRKARERVKTDAARPQGLLEDAGVRVDGDDKVRLVRDGRTVRSAERRELRQGDLVKVVRVRHINRVRTVDVDHGQRTRKVASLAPGKRKVAQRGRDGVRKIRVHSEWRNGRRLSREVRTRWVRKPQPRVVLVGQARRSVSGTGGLNWAGLARCESGGNPRAVNPAGYYGLYQFDLGTWRSVGGAGIPSQASASEQTFRAKKLYAARGRSPWPYCGRFL
ncbi:transglycosylase [Nocardioides sp. GY 10113]|uniref:resuscitation-promoting factor n=1 Tax=Nocardioides sp. GY 10113 TaxID=2569761 RepID=UPI0010A7A876|nr:resuscitation-promoting factor [Nocardioides sp. GY 10113]TIC85915.1 transglycosylase [Nocardioides sp. GY 10113]